MHTEITKLKICFSENVRMAKKTRNRNWLQIFEFQLHFLEGTSLKAICGIRLCKARQVENYREFIEVWGGLSQSIG